MSSHHSSSFSSTHTHIHTQECAHAHTHVCTQTHIWTDHLKIRDAFSLNILIILRGRRTNPLLPHNWDGEWELYRLEKSRFPPWIVMPLSCTRSACSGLIKSFSFPQRGSSEWGLRRFCWNIYWLCQSVQQSYKNAFLSHYAVLKL